MSSTRGMLCCWCCYYWISFLCVYLHWIASNVSELSVNSEHTMLNLMPKYKGNVDKQSCLDVESNEIQHKFKSITIIRVFYKWTRVKGKESNKMYVMYEKRRNRRKPLHIWAKRFNPSFSSSFRPYRPWTSFVFLLFFIA